MAVAAIVAGLAFAASWIISLYFVRTRKEEDELAEVELPGHLHEVMAGIPTTLVVFFSFILVSLVIYLLYVWLRGITY